MLLDSLLEHFFRGGKIFDLVAMSAACKQNVGIVGRQLQGFVDGRFRLFSRNVFLQIFCLAQERFDRVFINATSLSITRSATSARSAISESLIFSRKRLASVIYASISLGKIAFLSSNFFDSAL